MGNSSETKSNKPEKGEDLADRLGEATSKETVRDLEETEDIGTEHTEPGPGPSPDGSLDESDEIKDAGPM